METLDNLIRINLNEWQNVRKNEYPIALHWSPNIFNEMYGILFNMKAKAKTSIITKVDGLPGYNNLKACWDLFEVRFPDMANDVRNNLFNGTELGDYVMRCGGAGNARNNIVSRVKHVIFKPDVVN